MIEKKEPVLWNESVGSCYYRLGIACHDKYLDATPGQFVMLGISDSYYFSLRRPFSIHRLIMERGKINGIEILYKVAGKVTKIFSKYKEGDTINVLGPLGKGFSIPGPVEPVFIVGGGIGVAPMLFLADCLLKKNIDPSLCYVFMGGRTSEDILLADEFKSLGMNALVATDDGGAGHQGPVTDILENGIRKNSPGVIYACGPPGMLKKVSTISKKYSLPCQVSMETVMACGMGACLGCATKHKTDDRYLHMCMDGPVFDSGILRM